MARPWNLLWNLPWNLPWNLLWNLPQERELNGEGWRSSCRVHASGGDAACRV